MCVQHKTLTQSLLVTGTSTGIPDSAIYLKFSTTILLCKIICCFVLLMRCVMEKCVLSISFVWIRMSKFWKMNFFISCNLVFDFLDVTRTLIHSLLIVIVLNVKPLSSFTSIRIENLTLEWHTDAHAYVYVVSVWGYERFNLSTMTFHSQSHISNVMCQKINNPYNYIPYVDLVFVFVCASVSVRCALCGIGCKFNRELTKMEKHDTHVFFYDQ